MADRKAAAKTFLQQVIDAHVPADQREAAAALFLNNDAILGELGDGVLRQGDYTKQTAQLALDRQQLQAYYEENNPKVVAAAKLLALFPDGEVPADYRPGDPNPNPQEPVVDVTKLKTDILGDFTKQREEIERGGAAFMAKLTSLSNKHYAEFGTPLDTEALVANPRTFEVGLEGAYGESVAEAREAKRVAGVNAQIEAARKEGAAEAETRLRGQLVNQPYPTPNAGRSAVVAALETSRQEALDNPTAAATPRSFVNRVDAGAAAEEYHKLSATGA